MTDLLKDRTIESAEPAAITYAIELSPSGNKDFGSVKAGYKKQAAYDVTVINTGNQPTGKLSVTLSGDNSGSFSLSTASIHSIDPDKSGSFSVVPKTGLTMGVYTAVVTVSGDNNISAGFYVSFSVGVVSVTNVELTVTAPVTGNTPNTLASGSGDFTIGAVSWDPPDDPFMGNTAYTAAVTLTVNEGFTFSGLSSETVTINGKTAAITNNIGAAITLSYTFPKTQGYITNAAITVTAPVIGAVPNTLASGSGDFTIGAVSWSPGDNPFKVNTAYSATVTLAANENFKFTAGAAASINGNNAIVANNSGTKVTLSYTFPKPLAAISSAAVTVTVSETGHSPDAAVTCTGNFTASGVTWSPKDNPFRGGANYTATVTLTAEDGYSFTGLDSSNAAINGNAAAIAGNSGTEVTLSYTFPKTIPSITSASINVTPPARGNTPDDQASGSGNFTIGAVTWNPSDDPFLGNTAYTASVTLTANNGHTFFGIDNHDAAINGNTATVTSNTGTEVTLSYIFPKTASTPISNVTVTVTAPEKGFTPDTTPPAGTVEYSPAGVSWFHEGFPFSGEFLGKKEYTAAITLEANEGFTFTGLINITINGNSVTETDNSGTTLTIRYTFLTRAFTGSGTIEKPFVIETAEDLLLIGTDEELLKGHYIQTGDIELQPPEAGESSNWTPIGTNTKPFTGTFNGNGKKITLIIIDEPASQYQGMFGAIDSGGVVENVTLINSDISSSNYIGGIAGQNNGIVRNCSITDCTINGKGNRTGGIVGENNGTVENCYITGTVSGGNNQTGGVAGRNAGTIQYCVSLISSITANTSAIGRIVGQVTGSATLQNNYARNDMTVTGGNGGNAWSPANTHNGKDGADVNAGEYETETFWTGTMGWDFDTVWYWDDIESTPPRPVLQFEAVQP